jgi:lysozyme family protein
MAQFTEFQDKILEIEGGYQNDPDDSGNYNSRGDLVGTNYGISAKVYEREIGRPPDVDDMKSITQNQALSIYKRRYWDAYRLSELDSQMMANIVCDGIINHGPGNRNNKGGVTILQNCLNEIHGELVTIDGVLGSMTLAATNRQTKINLASLYNAYRTKRVEYYYEIATGKKAKFLSGWLNRMDKFPELDPVFSNAMSEKQERAEQTGKGFDEVIHFFKGLLSVHKSESARREWGVAILVVGIVMFLLIQNKKNYLP